MSNIVISIRYRFKCQLTCKCTCRSRCGEEGGCSVCYAVVTDVEGKISVEIGIGTEAEAKAREGASGRKVYIE